MKQEKDKLKLEEIKGHFRLAKIFLRVAEKRKESKNEGEIRSAVDIGYNSVEHCLKAFILLKSDTIPRRHSEIAQRFSKLYIKEGEFEKSLAKEVLTLAEELTTLLEEKIAQS